MGIQVGDIISHAEITMQEGVSLQKGMNFNMPSGVPVILMSTRRGAPYKDRVEDGGKTLIYEGHNVPKNLSDSPLESDQEITLPSGKLTENGRFFQAASDYKKGLSEAKLVKVYEKLRDGIWVFNGYFSLVDAFEELAERRVYKFMLLALNSEVIPDTVSPQLGFGRMIPSNVKIGRAHV